MCILQAMSEVGRLPNVQCPHIIPNPCTCYEPQPCCHRLAGNESISNASCATSPPIIPQSSATPDQTTEDVSSTDQPLTTTERPQETRTTTTTDPISAVNPDSSSIRHQSSVYILTVVVGMFCTFLL